MFVRRLLLVLGVLSGACIGAMAADMPTKAPAYTAPLMVPFSWTGFYVGVHGGADWFKKEWFTPLTPTNIAGGCGGCPTSAGDHSGSSWLLGGQVGFNYQIASWVLGVEAQGSWTKLEASNVSLFFPIITDHSKTKSLGLVAGRLGWTWDHVLVYGMGGGAWAQDTFWTTAAVCLPTACQTIDDTRWGWMAGAGVEYAFSQNWSVRAEYNYFDFGTRRETLAAVCATCLAFEYDVKQTIQSVKIGLNYRFGIGH